MGGGRGGAPADLLAEVQRELDLLSRQITHSRRVREAWQRERGIADPVYAERRSGRLSPALAPASAVSTPVPVAVEPAAPASAPALAAPAEPAVAAAPERAEPAVAAAPERAEPEQAEPPSVAVTPPAEASAAEQPASEPSSPSPRKVAQARGGASSPPPRRVVRQAADRASEESPVADESQPESSPASSPRPTAAEARRARSQEQQRLKERQAEEAAAKEQAAAAAPSAKGGQLQCLGKKSFRQSWKGKYCIADASGLSWYSSEQRDPASPTGKADGAVPWSVDITNSRGSTITKKSKLARTLSKDDHPKVGKAGDLHYFGVQFWSDEKYEWLCLAAESTQVRDEWIQFMAQYCDVRP
eukprot:TRINITY_DN832_c0_g1_i1.p1 TRINITY_DN832_c0_g1~~TRINITY_DN832_c0_g1_i1.p1  ORF type:complete len:380 (+),score=134.45 TRINITY_DN832_c0_g1_i1:65-1141(+)